MTKEQFKEVLTTVVAPLKKEKPEVIESKGGVNAMLMEMYREQTGQEDFRTFRKWKEAGYSVKKGERSYAIFSRPISAIKAEKQLPTNEDDVRYFGIAHLFHAGQVELTIKEEKNA